MRKRKMDKCEVCGKEAKILIRDFTEHPNFEAGAMYNTIEPILEWHYYCTLHQRKSYVYSLVTGEKREL
jgi:hypothetical protein